MIKTTNSQYLNSFWVKLIVLSVVCVGLYVLLPVRTEALAVNPSGTFLSQTSNFYAYVQTTENLDLSFVKATNGSGVGDVDAVITLSRPGSLDVTCTVFAASAVSSSCNLPNETASQSGIWRIRFVHTGVIDDYTWTIGVQTGVTDIPGRVWTEAYRMTQHAGSPPIGVNFSFWYQSEAGYQYRADYADYHGIESDIYASSLGLVLSGGGCTPLYKSVNRNATNYALPPTSCNAEYKEFFELPASDLPASGVRWDASTDWIKPTIATPTITNLAFTSATTNSRDGDISFDLANYNGPINVYVDTNNNSSYADPEDVTIPYTAISGNVMVPYDGKDGNGNTIPSSQAINFRVSVERIAEIHFLMTDVELRGSMEVQRLNGPAGDESIIYWDDTNFSSPDANRCSLTSLLDGTAGIDSAGGVHGWTLSGCGAPQYGNFNNFINGSWGDQRIINDWAYVPSNTFAVLGLSAYNNPAAAAGAATLADTGQETLMFIALAGLLVGAPSITWFVFKKRLLT